MKAPPGAVGFGVFELAASSLARRMGNLFLRLLELDK